MPLYEKVRLGGASVAIAVCDRCRLKMSYNELSPDPNAPGLRVCPACLDVKDPYRKPMRKPESIALRFPRPDEELV